MQSTSVQVPHDVGDPWAEEAPWWSPPLLIATWWALNLALLWVVSWPLWLVS